MGAILTLHDCCFAETRFPVDRFFFEEYANDDFIRENLLEMIVLGFHAFTHDSSASLVTEDGLIAYAEEERFTRVKGEGGFPENAIRHCLSEGGVKPSEVEQVILPFRPRKGALRRLLYLANPPGAFGVRFMDLFWKGLRMLSVDQSLRRMGFCVKTRYADHYLAHASAVFLSSPFEEALVLVMDGVAEGWSGAVFHGRRNGTPALRLLARFPFPGSPGLAYAAITEHLGFRSNRDEGRVMAMSALGDDRYLREMQNLFRFEERKIVLKRGFFDFAGTWTTSRFHRVFGAPRKPGDPLKGDHFALARAVQTVVEEGSLFLAKLYMEKTDCRNLCFTGGLALNPALNGTLLRESGCRSMYVFPPGGDAGTSIGGALMNVPVRSWSLPHPYWGSAYSISRCERVAESMTDCVITSGAAAEKEAADLLSRGRIGGWFRGKSEMGPRALGHRSILADPRFVEGKDRLNRNVKHREPFRPFAPAMLLEESRAFFPDIKESPFMLYTFPVPSETAVSLPAIVHVDKTSRVQTVTRGDESGLFDVLTAFQKRTGFPVLLNTSLNLQNEPLADSPEDAIRVFVQGDLDFLMLEDLLISRRRTS